MLQALLSIIPLIVAAVATPLFAAFRSHVMPLVPDRYVPIFLPILAAVVGAVANWLGVDAAILNEDPTNVSAWETVGTAILTALAMTGMHQISRQLGKKE